MKNMIPNDLAVRYAKYVDDREFERFREIMLPNFTQQGPGFASSSLDEFIASLDLLENYSATFHLIGQQSGVWNGDHYVGETWGVASHIYDKEGEVRKFDMGIRYADIIDVIDGDGWFVSRNLDVVWTQDLSTGT